MQKIRMMGLLWLIFFSISTAGCDIGIKLIEAVVNASQDKESSLEYHQRRMKEVDGPGWTDLHRAAAKGDVASVQMLLDQGIAVDTQNESVGTPLYEATRRGHLNVMKLLLKKGANVNSTGHHGFSPLSLAAEYNQLEAARLLLKHGADIHFRDPVGNTPLHQTALRPWHGDSKMAKLLIEEGKADMSLLSYGGCYPLYCAVSKNNTPVALYLLSKGADANFVYKKRMPTLYFAVDNNNFEVTKALLQHGAKPNSIYNDERTALQQAVINNDIQIVRLLLKYKADPNLLPYNSESTLYWPIAVHRDSTLVFALLKGGADPNVASSPDKLPLYLAVKWRDVPLARILLNYGADPTLKVGNRTIQKFAVDEGRQEIIALISQSA